MMPVIQAREQLRSINTLHIGTAGRVEPDVLRDAVSALELAANHGSTPQRQAQRFASGEDALAFMSSVGAG